MMSAKYIVTIASSDRVGIVADVTHALLSLKGNLENVSQTVLQGYFSMILLANFPDGTTQSSLQANLQTDPALSDCNIQVLPYQEHLKAEQQQTIGSDSYVLTASSQDRPGLVADLSRLIQTLHGNIIDLACHTRDGLFTMLYLINLPATTDISTLKQKIRQDFPDVAIGIRHQKLFEMVNEI